MGTREVGSEDRDRLGHFTAVVAKEQDRSESQIGLGSVSGTQSDRMIIKRSDGWEIENEPATICEEENVGNVPRRVMHSTI